MICSSEAKKRYSTLSRILLLSRTDGKKQVAFNNAVMANSSHYFMLLLTRFDDSLMGTFEIKYDDTGIMIIIHLMEKRKCTSFNSQDVGVESQVLHDSQCNLLRITTFFLIIIVPQVYLKH